MDQTETNLQKANRLIVNYVDGFFGTKDTMRKVDFRNLKRAAEVEAGLR